MRVGGASCETGAGAGFTEWGGGGGVGVVLNVLRESRLLTCHNQSPDSLSGYRARVSIERKGWLKEDLPCDSRGQAGSGRVCTYT